MLYSKRSLCWVKPMLLGRILLNLLGVLGSSIIAAPLADSTSVDLGISSWTAAGAGGSVFSTVIFLFADGVRCDGCRPPTRSISRVARSRQPCRWRSSGWAECFSSLQAWRSASWVCTPSSCKN
ncbi:hypothetical protein CUR178_04717 [Leishmania enriettii]|uniref:Uncharacterized protein n=1 Tax=Leishmania enriettii TaxID=5663 RepID=A0A836H1M7_LEIEN|nr:hypothetical protein CUR178_04717 [Leishmania enriettii]